MAEPTAPPSPFKLVWFFDRETDLWTFLGSAGGAVLAVLLVQQSGLLDAPLPPWMWALTVMGVDVAHVHATWYRTYLQPGELRRRPLLYGLTPVLCLLASLLLYARSGALFWTCLAYMAVFHFVRQPYGFVMLSRVKGGEAMDWTRNLDGATIYAATLWPLLWWHGHLPRRFNWFMENDFVVGISAKLAEVLFPLYAGLLIAFALKELWHFRCTGVLHSGKLLIVGTTALSWWLGIVYFDSDIAFTLTNVLPHGIPYLVLLWRTVSRQSLESRGRLVSGIVDAGPLIFLLLLVLTAIAEEALWDKGVWGDHPMFFGQKWALEAWVGWWVPLLTLPQLTHYVLDGFIWKRSKLPDITTI